MTVCEFPGGTDSHRNPETVGYGAGTGESRKFTRNSSVSRCRRQSKKFKSLAEKALSVGMRLGQEKQEYKVSWQCSLQPTTLNDHQKELLGERKMDCAICGDAVFEKNGLECSGSDLSQRHFVCADCLCGYVAHESRPDNFGASSKRQGRVPCPGRPCDSEPYEDAALATRLPGEVFQSYLQQRQRVLEAGLVAKNEQAVQDRVQQEVERLQRMGEEERQIRAACQRIREDILTLKVKRVLLLL